MTENERAENPDSYRDPAALDFSCETISDQASPFNFFIAAVNLGTTSNASPTIP